MECMKFLAAPPEQMAFRPSKRRICNQDPAWHAHVARLEPVIRAIAIKACAADEDLREDCVQEALFELSKHYPEDCDSYREKLYGLIDDQRCLTQLQKFCRQIARNTIYSLLGAYPTGNWYSGRTRSVIDKRTGKSTKVHMPARFSSLDELVDDYGMQIDETGKVSWTDLSGENVSFQQSGTFKAGDGGTDA